MIDQKPELEHVRDGASDHHVTCRHKVDEVEAVPVELPAGGAVFFNFATPHCTRANGTDQARAGVSYHFLHEAHFRDRAFPLPENAEWCTPLVCGTGYAAGVPEYSR